MQCDHMLGTSMPLDNTIHLGSGFTAVEAISLTRFDIESAASKQASLTALPISENMQLNYTIKELPFRQARMAIYDWTYAVIWIQAINISFRVDISYRALS